MQGTPSFEELKRTFAADRLEQDKKAEAFARSRSLGPLDLNTKKLRSIKISPVRKAGKGEILALVQQNEAKVRKMLDDGCTFGDVARALQDDYRVTVSAQSVNDYCRKNGIKRAKHETPQEKFDACRDEIWSRLSAGETQYAVATSLGFSPPTFGRVLRRSGIKLIGDRWVDERK